MTLRLNLRQIEAFRSVYQTGSMTVGGELMGVSQPAISRLIRDLEAEIGFPLFERTRGRLTPTADAAEFYREVQRSFHGLDRLGHVARELQQRRVGDLRIASTVAMSFYLLPRVIGRFRQAWPNVKLALYSCPSPEVLECVATQQYDVGVAVTPSDVPGVTAIDLPALETVCVLAEDHPLAAKSVIRPRDLDGEPLLIISEYSITQRKILQSLEDAGIRQNIIMEATNSAPICDLISQKAGLSILEPVTARAFTGRGIVIRPYEPAILLAMKFVHAANRPLSDRGRAFCALVKEEMETFQADSRN
jgi:DNA-binding transcriptional LysR family regulator